jgi:hypothetical protein
MQIESQNKMVASAENKGDMPTTIKAVSTLINEYFFPGGGVWKPMSVKAPNREQAEEIHKATREPVSPAPEKVEQETNNQ